MRWLSENSAAVPAIATIVLIAITVLYVWLTARLAGSAREQADAANSQAAAALETVRLMKEAAERERDRVIDEAMNATERRWTALQGLHEGAERLLEDLESLPEAIGSSPPIDHLRAAHIWDSGALAELQHTADRTADDSIQMAVLNVVPAVAWLRTRISQVQTPKGAKLRGVACTIRAGVWRASGRGHRGGTLAI